MAPMSDHKLTVKPMTASTWPDFEALFESKGAPSYCWCMAWRAIGNRQRADKAERKAAMYERVRRRTPIGLLGYVGKEPVAWCSVAPRETFIKLKDGQDETEGAWSVVCFFVRREFRKTGLSARMLEEAVRWAKRRGARVVEGYPVDPDSHSYRFMGFVPLFEAQGFKPAGRAGTRRHVMRLEL
jgi:GNAT superfamily N-acetyltransferase